MSCHGSQMPGPSGAAPRVLGMCQERGITFWGLWLGPGDRNGSLKPTSPGACPWGLTARPTPPAGRKGETGSEKCRRQEAARDGAALRERGARALLDTGGTGGH